MAVIQEKYIGGIRQESGVIMPKAEGGHSTKRQMNQVFPKPMIRLNTHLPKSASKKSSLFKNNQPDLKTKFRKYSLYKI